MNADTTAWTRSSLWHIPAYLTTGPSGPGRPQCPYRDPSLSPSSPPSLTLFRPGGLGGRISWKGGRGPDLPSLPTFVCVLSFPLLSTCVHFPPLRRDGTLRCTAATPVSDRSVSTEVPGQCTLRHLYTVLDGQSLPCVCVPLTRRAFWVFPNPETSGDLRVGWSHV